MNNVLNIKSIPPFFVCYKNMYSMFIIFLFPVWECTCNQFYYLLIVSGTDLCSNGHTYKSVEVLGFAGPVYKHNIYWNTSGNDGTAYSYNIKSNTCIVHYSQEQIKSDKQSYIYTDLFTYFKPINIDAVLIEISLSDLWV